MFLDYEHIEYLWLLLLLPALMLVYWFYRIWRRKAASRFGNIEQLSRLNSRVSARKGVIKSFLIFLALYALVFGIANPRLGYEKKLVEREGIDLVFAMDVSLSMKCEDLTPSRLAKSRQIVSRVLDKLGGDRVGIILYAGNAYAQLPITTDYSVARMILSNVSTDLIPTQGTAVAEALEMSLDFFDNTGAQSKLLVILSDGEDHEEGFEELTDDLIENNIKVNTIGIGTEQGGPIPIKRGGRIIGFKKDMSDNVVVSKMEKTALEELATKTGGTFADGTYTSTAVDAVLKSVDELEAQKFEEKELTDFRPQFQWFLFFAIFLLALEMILGEKRSKVMQRLNTMLE